MFKPSVKIGGTNPWGDGTTFEFTLKQCHIKMGERPIPSKDQNRDIQNAPKEPWPQMTFGYEDNEGEGLDEKYVNAPKDFVLNDRATFYQRIAHVLGMTPEALVKEGEDSKLGFDFGTGVDTYDAILEQIKGGAQIPVGITYDGSSIFGRKLNLTIKTSGSGWARIASSAPLLTSTKKKSAVTTSESEFKPRV